MDQFWVQHWVQLKRGEWLRIFGKRHHIGHLDFSPDQLLTEGLLVRIQPGEPIPFRSTKLVPDDSFLTLCVSGLDISRVCGRW
jgi:hypothetical protein